jgi:hypothetical protein
MKKTYIIITILVAAALIAAVYLIFSKNKEAPVGETGNQPIGNLPIQMPQETSIRVKDINNPAQIKDSFQKYTEEDVKSFPLYVKEGISQAYSVDDGKGNLADFEKFLSSVDAKVKPELANMAGSKYYGFFYCPNEKGGKDFGFTFELGGGDAQGLKSINTEAKELMRQWEPDILKDLRNILFPGKKFTAEQINQSVVFKDGKFRYADINLPEGEKGSINYIVNIYPPDHPSSTNSVSIATSRECLQKSLDSLFDF